MTEDSLDQLPRWKRWGFGLFAALLLSGILPALGACLLEAVCEVVGWWLLLPLLAAELYAIWRVILP